MTLLAQLTRLAHIDESFDGDIRSDWDDGDVTPRDILDAADESAPGQARRSSSKDDATIEVLADGATLEIDVKDERDWDKNVHIRAAPQPGRGLRRGPSASPPGT